MLTLNEAFAAVAEHGGIAAGARALGRDPSVISRRLDALEARLGVKLLSRSTRQVAVTDVGQAYLGRVQTILAELSAADAEAVDRAASPRGLLRVSLPATFARLWVVPWLPGFLADHPQIRVELDQSDRFVDLIEERIDTAIRIGALPDSALLVRRLAPVRSFLCASPAYVAANGMPSSPRDLANHRCLGLARPDLWPEWQLRRGVERVVVRVDGPLLSHDGATMVTACRHGAGIAMASDWSVGRDLVDGRLVRILPDWEADRDSAVHVVMPPGRLLPAKTRAFVDRLIREMTPVAPWRRIETDMYGSAGATSRQRSPSNGVRFLNWYDEQG